MLVLVPVLVLVAYGHTLPYDFEFDDLQAIRDNDALDRPGDLEGIWRHRPSRFVLYLSFALNIALTGRSPSGLRLVNIAIHVVTALVVGMIGAALASKLAPPVRTGPGARSASPAAIGLLAGSVFAVHPIATQAVTYVIQRTTSLATLWELTAVLLYLRARASGRAIAWAGSWLAALLAALTKEMAVALPVLILALEWALRRFVPGDHPSERSTVPRAAWLMPYLLVWPLVFLTTRLPSVEEGIPLPGLRETSVISWVTYGLTQCVVIPHYLRIVFWPAGQNLDHDVTLRPVVDGAVLAGMAVLAILTLAAWWQRRRAPLVWVGWVWFLIALLPESSVFPITDVMFEHRVYMPLVGLAFAVGSLLATFAASGPKRWLLPAAILTALTTVTHVRNRVWKDEVSLWTDAAEKAPRNARARNNLGIAFEKRGRMGEAESAYRKVLELSPTDIDGLMNLARFHGMRGRYREALALQQRAERLMPNAPDILTDLGTTWWALGDTAQAAAYFTRAVEIASRRVLTSRTGAEVARHAARNLARLRAAQAARIKRGSTEEASPAERGTAPRSAPGQRAMKP